METARSPPNHPKPLAEEICSPYRVSWHVDRACNMVSAKTLDGMCKVMKEVMGMKKDLYPHGSRELVDPKWSGAASKSNFARRDDGVPFTRFPRAGSRTSR